MKKKARAAADSINHDETVIAQGCRVVGELSLSGRLRVDGVVEGELRGSGDVRIIGRFKGRLQATTVVVSGELLGDVVCESLEIASGGQVQGEVTCMELIIREGGRFMGRRIEQVSV